MKNLNEKAMLAQLSLSVWTGRVKDGEVSEEVVKQKGAESDTGAWWTYSIPRKSMSSLFTAYGKLRTVHNKWTLPWNDSGVRILPSQAYMDYTKDMRQAKSEFETEVNKFLEEYPKIIANAQTRLGKLANNRILPTVAEIRSKFGIEQHLFPLPNTKDFRLDLDEQDVEAIKNEMEQALQTMTEKAMADIWQRFMELLTKLEATLGTADKVFRNSLLSNLTEFCNRIPKLNITENSSLENLRKEVLTKLTKLQPDELRENKEARKNATKDVKDIIEKMKVFTV